MGRGTEKQRIAVAMSGGVDSSVAACLLVRAGHDVVGFYLEKAAASGDSGPVCGSVPGGADARLVADQLGIPLHAVDVTERFAAIITRFVESYRCGRTPNPCVECNVEVKFGHLLEVARAMGASRLATGHYARIERRAGRHVLTRARSLAKDQSYVLSGLCQDQLSRALFPLGDLSKDEVRELARAAGLAAAAKPESQEACFVPTGDYRDLLASHLPDWRQPGDIVTMAGDVVGRHDGLAGFTIGQRRGLRVALGSRRHVVRVETDSRRVVIGTRREASARTFDVLSANWVSQSEPERATEFRCEAQIRYRHRGAPATANWLAPGRFRVRFDEPQFAVTPGQRAALYTNHAVLAAGTIDKVHREVEECDP